MQRLGLLFITVLLLGIGAGFGIALLVLNGEPAVPANFEPETGSAQPDESVQVEAEEPTPQQARASVQQESGTPPQQDSPMVEEEIDECDDCPAAAHYGPHVHNWRMLLLGIHLLASVRTIQLESGCFVDEIGPPSPLHSETILALARQEAAATVDLMALQAENLRSTVPAIALDLAIQWTAEIGDLRRMVDGESTPTEEQFNVDCESELANHLGGIFGDVSRRDVPRPWSAIQFWEIKPILRLVALNRIHASLDNSIRLNCHSARQVAEGDLAYFASGPQLALAVIDWIADDHSYLASRIRDESMVWQHRVHRGLVSAQAINPCPQDLMRLVAMEYVTASFFGEFTGAADAGAFEIFNHLVPIEIALRTYAKVYGCDRNSTVTTETATVSSAVLELARSHLAQWLPSFPGRQPKHDLSEAYAVVVYKLPRAFAHEDYEQTDSTDGLLCQQEGLDMIDGLLVMAGEKLVDVPRP